MSNNIRLIIRSIIKESIDGGLLEIDWKDTFKDVSETCIDPQSLVTYLNKVIANQGLHTYDREKFNLDKPYIHAKSSFFDKNIDGIDIEDFAKRITEKPKNIINTNDKILKSGGVNEYVFKTGIPALRGIVYDIENKSFHVINTCPGAGSCIAICYARKGNYIMYPTSYDSMTRRLNYFMNFPKEYEEQMYKEIKAQCKTYKALKGYKSEIIIRWNDSGDFFTQKYVDIAENVIKKLNDEGFNVRSYAYTKIANVARDASFGTTFSVGANKGQASKVDYDKQKQSLIVPKDMFKDLDLMMVGDDKILKSRISDKFGYPERHILTYEELISTPKSNKPKWVVIVTPQDGDDAAFREDVKVVMLTQH